MFRRCCRPSKRALLESINRKVDAVMTDLTALNDAVDALVATDAAAAAEMSALREEIGKLTAGTITQEQIDALAQRVTDASSALAAAVQVPDGGVGGTGAEAPAPEEPPVAEAPAEETGPEGSAPGDEGVPGDEAPAEEPPAPEAPAPDQPVS